MSVRRASLLAVGSMVASCTAMAPVGDYAAYRAYRYEPAGPEHLAAGSAYLAQYPNGRFQPQVAAEVLGAEEDYWQEHRSSPDGLREYLTAFPTGPHVEEAHQRQGVFDAARRQQEQARREAEAAAQAQVTQQLAASAAQGRVLTRIRFATWMGAFGGIQGWGQGFGAVMQGNPDLGAQFENAPPVCRGIHCRKDWRQDFNIRVQGRTAISQAVLFTLDLIRSGPATNRLLSQVGLVVHNRGLTHWWESEHNEPVEASDAAAREASVAWSMMALRAMTVTLFTGARETPAALYGPPPEPVMQGVAEDENAETPVVDPNACVIPSQPFGTRWSAVVGCENITSNPLTASTEALTEQTAAFGEGHVPAAVTPHACLRIDAYAALDAEGMSTDEGVLMSLIPACALQPGAAPARPGRPARPARPGARPAAPAAAPAAH